jgi:hypothetical protein
MASRPEWFRQLRDQCASAGTPFFFKQWGDFLPEDMPDAQHLEWQAGYDDHRVFRFSDGLAVIRLGKKKAGAYLDDHAHRGFPEACHV